MTDNMPFATLAVLSAIAFISGIAVAASSSSALGPFLLMVGGFGLIMTLVTASILVGLQHARRQS